MTRVTIPNDLLKLGQVCFRVSMATFPFPPLRLPLLLVALPTTVHQHFLMVEPLRAPTHLACTLLLLPSYTPSSSSTHPSQLARRLWPPSNSSGEASAGGAIYFILSLVSFQHARAAGDYLVPRRGRLVVRLLRTISALSFCPQLGRGLGLGELH